MVGTYFDHCWWGWGWGWGGVMGGQQQAAALPSLPCTSPPPLHSPSATPTLVLAGRAVLALLMLVVVMVIVVMVVVALLPRTLCHAGLAAVVCMPILCVAVAVVVAVMPLPPPLRRPQPPPLPQASLLPPPHPCEATGDGRGSQSE